MPWWSARTGVASAFWIAVAGLDTSCASQSRSTTTGQETSPPVPVAVEAAQSARTPAGIAPASLPPLEGASGEEAEAESLLPETYPEAIRLRNFEQAAALIDALPDPERSKPEVRFARARVALELDQPDAALKGLSGLELQAPEVKNTIARLVASAERRSGNPDAVIEYYGKKRTATAELVIAHSLAEAERWAEARVWVDKAIARLGRRGSLRKRAEARALRFDIAKAQKHKWQAIADARWLALEAPTQPASEDALAKLSEVAPEQKLTKQQHKKRAEAFAGRGLVEKTEKELELLEAAPGAPVASIDKIAILADAVYSSRSDYLRAALLFQKAAAESPKYRDKHLYYEAKSLSRAHRDADAIPKYEALVSHSPRSHYADAALYNAARLRFIEGLWKESVEAYETYLRRRGNTGRYGERVRYELAVARLVAGDHERARKDIERLRLRTRNSREAARLLELRGVAEELAGDRQAAIETYQRVIGDLPLSLPAMFARERLIGLGEQSPPLIPPAHAEPPPPALEVTLPDDVAFFDHTGFDVDAEEALVFHEASIRRDHGARWGEALCRTYGLLQSARRRYQVAQGAVTSRALNVAPSPSTKWQWDCVYPQPYSTIVERAEQERKLPPHLVHAVMRQESGFHTTVVSPAYAVGLMQIIEPTAKRIAEEIEATYSPSLMRAPAVNIRFGAYYLRRLLDMFGDRPALALAGYNAGPHALGRWLRSGEQLPLDVFVAQIPYEETRNYVYRVVGNWARYSYLTGGEEAVPRIALDIPKGLQASDDAY